MPNDELPNLEESLVASFKHADLVSTAAELAEVAMDQLLKEGWVRDVPVLGSIAGAYRGVGMIRDRIFTSKVIRFLRQLGKTSQAERDKFLYEVEEPSQRRRLGETLVLLLDRHNDMEKPEMLARLFAGYVEKQYDFATFRKLADVLDVLPLHSIAHLAALYSGPPVMLGQRPPAAGEYHGRFVNAGVLDLHFTATPPVGASSARYAETELGKLFLKIVPTPDLATQP